MSVLFSSPFTSRKVLNWTFFANNNFFGLWAVSMDQTLTFRKHSFFDASIRWNEIIQIPYNPLSPYFANLHALNGLYVFKKDSFTLKFRKTISEFAKHAYRNILELFSYL